MVSGSIFISVTAQRPAPSCMKEEVKNSFATRCIESHCDYKTVSVLLGHANIGTTLNLSTSIPIKSKNAAVLSRWERSCCNIFLAARNRGQSDNVVKVNIWEYNQSCR